MVLKLILCFQFSKELDILLKTRYFIYNDRRNRDERR